MNLEIIHFIVLLITINIVTSLVRTFFKQKTLALYCGIIGFSSKRVANPDKLALLMYHNSIERGKDNTGIYSLETGVVKTAKRAEEFLAEFALPPTKLFIGHVRKSSVGSKEEKNAHPFENENIVLVHNGTLTNHWRLCTDHGYKSADFNTDTQVLAKLIDDDSKDEKVAFSTLSKFLGTAALLFTDKRDPSILYAYRNDDRPLYNGMINGSMYISSLKENLTMINCKDIKEFPSFYLHTIKDGKFISSIYYKPAETEKVNYGSNHITNVKYKNTNNVDDFIKSLQKSNDISHHLLADRWVRALADCNQTYMKKSVKLTADKWYFIEDSSVENDYDLQFKDDNGNLIWHNKFLFDLSHIDYPNNYACAVVNVFDKSKNSVLMYAKDTIIEIAPLAMIDKNNTLSCIYNKEEIVDIDINCIRPATLEEANKYIEKNVEEFNKKLNEQSIINFAEVVSTTHLPALPAPSKDEIVDEAAVSSETEIMPKEPDETEIVLSYVLDVLDNTCDDLVELAEVTNYDELKTKVQELKDLINESYNIEMVRETIFKD